MRITYVIAAAVAAVTLFPLASHACDEHARKTAVKMVSLDEAAKLQKDARATFLDANDADTRGHWGVIPGATLLTSSADYSLAELPKDKNAKLVFYCANTRCTASQHAAARAAKAGYSDVNVLPEGIIGWKGAGKPTSVPRS
jgi:rhodanese-related sulfurtransferase